MKSQCLFLAAAFAVTGCGGKPKAQTISIIGSALDPERAVAARTGNLAALFGPADMTGPCWTEPCDNNEAFELSKMGGVRITVLGHPETPPATTDAEGAFTLTGVPAKSRVNLVLERPGDPIYIKTLDGIIIRTGTVDLKGLPFHICRNDKILKALVDKEGPAALDNGAVLALVNNDVPLPENGPLTKEISVAASGGKVLYVGFEFEKNIFVVDDNPEMSNHAYANWLGAIMVSVAAPTPQVTLTITDTSLFPDPVTRRPYTFPVVQTPLLPGSSSFVLLYPTSTGT